MDAIELRQTFKHEGLTYTVMMSHSSGFGCELTEGSSPKGSTQRNKYDLWWDERVIIQDVDLVSNALPVYRKAGEILIGWFYAKRPWRLHFRASTDRKVKIYRWFAKRLQKKLSAEYQMIEYPKGHFEFYRGPEPD